MSKLAKALTAAAGNAGESLYVEDVFSTYLYTGTNATQTITNGIDLSGEGGLVWTKNRDGLATEKDHQLMDSEQSAFGYYLESNNSNAAVALSNIITPQSDGFNLSSLNRVNQSGKTYASWTFRKAEKFFDVVTYTGNGTNNRQIPHNLGSIPHFILVKSLGFSASWYALHYDGSSWTSLVLNSTAAGSTASGAVWGDGTNFVAPTSTDFTVASFGSVNADTYGFVAYLFASDAGGFGDDGSESIIKCGSYTADGSGNASVNLGFEPQWLLVKSSTALENWIIIDNMRGLVVGGSDPTLYANLINSEYSAADSNRVNINATGFETIANRFNVSTANQTYIYIAIRRPMKTPESGTEVFAPNTIASSVTDGTQINSGFAIDMNMIALRGGSGVNFVTHDRLRGVSTTTSNGGLYLETTATQAENTGFSRYFNNTGFQLPSTLAGSDLISYSFKRATGFFDVVAYTGDGVAGRTVAHNLGVAPEMIIIKRRESARDWGTGFDSLGWTMRGPAINSTEQAYTTSLWWNNTAPTNTEFTLGTSATTNSSSGTYIAYLFATLAGVSKVGSYTGTGSNVDVNCGFSAGARFILIKRTDSTGDWYVWDSVRGIVAGNDPYLLLNSTAAEVTSTDYIDPLASGFTVTSSAPAALNASGGTYIFLAIA